MIANGTATRSIIELLNAQTSATRESPVHIALRHGHRKLVAALVGWGCNCNVQDKDGYTAATMPE